MKYILIILLTSISLGVFAQKEKLYIGEVDSIKGVYIPNSLEESFIELNKLLPDTTKQHLTEMREEEAINKLHFGLGMWIRNNWGLWVGSRLALYFNRKEIFHPDDMSSIILTSYYRHLNDRKINLLEQINSYKKYWAAMKKEEMNKEDEINKKSNSNLKWLHKNGILLNSLPKANQSEIIYTCDSTLLLKRVNGDTTIIWTIGVESYLDTTQIKEWIKKDEFGERLYIKGVNYQGNITLISLSPKTFYVSNDSLFELETFYKIPIDSLTTLYMEMLESNDTFPIKDYQQIINENTYDKFKLIFHPNMFLENSSYTGNIKGDIIDLDNIWKVNENEYFEITIKNNFGKHDNKYTYLFDKNYKLLKYDGCNKDELEKLKNKDELENNR